MYSICGSLLIALSLTIDGRFNTLFKWSVHLSKIASLSVRRVLPSALSSWWIKNSLGHKPFSVHYVLFGFLLLSCPARSFACPDSQELSLLEFLGCACQQPICYLSVPHILAFATLTKCRWSPHYDIVHEIPVFGSGMHSGCLVSV